jgi:hypothetical protein
MTDWLQVDDEADSAMVGKFDQVCLLPSVKSWIIIFLIVIALY